MLKRFLPRETGFFTLFQRLTNVIVSTSHDFHQLLKNLNNPQSYVDIIAIKEEEGDKIAHECFTLLHKTFITPFDRHDINILISGLDDILDLINRCAQRFSYYELKNIPQEILTLSDLTQQACALLQQAIHQLHSLKKAELIFQYCEEINDAESTAHQMVLAGEKKLFLEENDFKTFLKFKDIYTQMKMVINSCQDVANIIKGIILEYS